jgi:hypothetical protein
MAKISPRAWLLAASTAVLAGCAPQPQGGASTGSYVGRPVADYVADHGTPDSTIPLTDSKSLFRWDLGVQAMGPAIGTGVTSGGGAPPSSTPTVCSVTLSASTQSPKPQLKDWIVQGFERQGVC